jgi:hypothetical protein
MKVSTLFLILLPINVVTQIFNDKSFIDHGLFFIAMALVVCIEDSTYKICKAIKGGAE